MTATAPAALLVLTTQPGCFIFGSPGPSSVGQGHKYVSGNPEYDAYFSRLYDLQVEMATAPDTEKEVRQKLAKKLGVDQDASASLLARKVKKEAEKLEKHGIGLKLEFDEGDEDAEPSVKLEATGGKLSGDAKSFTDDVVAAVEKEAKLAAKMKKNRKLLDQLRAQAIPLEANVDTVFRKGGLSKKAEVKKNLKDANSIMTLMAARADQVSDAAKEAAKKLAEAMATDHGQFKVPEEVPAAEEPKENEKEKEKEKEAGKKPKPHWHPPAHSGGTPPPKPPPPKPPKPPPSDFEP